ncbi:MAG TPA: NUDIX domain-containing protein [Caulobacteraceae bacterium]|nr:NUDIX domain-containing protein [Caulobacteraceae bacterium]
MSFRLRFERLIRPVYQAYSRRSRGMTLGVRGLVQDGERRVLLVRHTYSRGWHMPGGGVERGETAADAMTRELLEEAGVTATAPLQMVSIHSAEAHFRGDHIVLFRVPAWEIGPPTQTGEIAEIGWFAPDALPDAATTGTRARVAEAVFGRLPHAHW